MIRGGVMDDKGWCHGYITARQHALHRSWDGV